MLSVLHVSCARCFGIGHSLKYAWKHFAGQRDRLGSCVATPARLSPDCFRRTCLHFKSACMEEILIPFERACHCLTCDVHVLPCLPPSVSPLLTRQRASEWPCQLFERLSRQIPSLAAAGTLGGQLISSGVSAFPGRGRALDGFHDLAQTGGPHVGS